MQRRLFLSLPLAASSVRAVSQDLYKRIIRSLEAVESVDTHEHIVPEEQRVSEPLDFLHLRV
jgi:hypothetical protein